MKEETFQFSIALISEAFPKREINVALWWELLNDLPDQPFKQAVIELVKETEQLYPDSNVIAILRHSTQEFWRREKNKYETKKLEECAPPPQIWKDMIKRLAKKKDANR